MTYEIVRVYAVQTPCENPVTGGSLRNREVFYLLTVRVYLAPTI